MIGSGSGMFLRPLSEFEKYAVRGREALASDGFEEFFRPNCPEALATFSARAMRRAFMLLRRALCPQVASVNHTTVVVFAAHFAFRELQQFRSGKMKLSSHEPQ